jgi:hypothetical protein
MKLELVLGEPEAGDHARVFVCPGLRETHAQEGRVYFSADGMPKLEISTDMKQHAEFRFCRNCEYHEKAPYGS